MDGVMLRTVLRLVGGPPAQAWETKKLLVSYTPLAATQDYFFIDERIASRPSAS